MRNLNVETIAKKKKDYTMIIGKKFEESEDMLVSKETTRNSLTSILACSIICCPY